MFHDVGNITFQKIAKAVNRTSGHPLFNLADALGIQGYI